MEGLIMRVTIVFEYADVDDANGADADAIIERLTDACEGMKWDYNATNVWVDDATCEEG
jgi:hypothetical protein